MIDKELIMNNAKILLGIKTNEHDLLINLLVDKAIADIKAFCNNDFIDEQGEFNFPDELVSALEDLVVYRYNLRGVEGISSESLGNKSVTYNSDIPNHIKSRLYPYRKMRVW